MSFLSTSLLIAAVALVFERFAGYPDALVSRIGHPVIWIGKLVGLCEARLNDAADNGPRRRWLGLAMLLIVLFAVALVTVPLTVLLRVPPLGWVLEGDASKLKGPIRIAAKDLRFYNRMAEAAPMASPIAQACSQVYQLAAIMGHSERFMPVLPGILAELNGTKIRDLDES